MTNKMTKTNQDSITNNKVIFFSGLFFILSVVLIIFSQYILDGNSKIQMIILALSIAISGHENAIVSIEKMLMRKFSFGLAITLLVLLQFCLGFTLEAATTSAAFLFIQIIMNLLKHNIAKECITFSESKRVFKVEGERLIKTPVSLLFEGDIIRISKGDEIPLLCKKIVDNKEYFAGYIYEDEDADFQVIKPLNWDYNFEKEYNNKTNLSASLNKICVCFCLFAIVVSLIVIFVQDINIKQKLLKFSYCVLMSSPQILSFGLMSFDLLINAIFKFCGLSNFSINEMLQMSNIKELNIVTENFHSNDYIVGKEVLSKKVKISEKSNILLDLKEKIFIIYTRCIKFTGGVSAIARAHTSSRTIKLSMLMLTFLFLFVKFVSVYLVITSSLHFWIFLVIDAIISSGVIFTTVELIKYKKGK